MSRTEEFANGREVMRGMAVQLPAAFARRAYRLLGPAVYDDEIDQEKQLGDDMLDHLDVHHRDANRGLGAHWTGKRNIAEIASGISAGGRHTPVIVHGVVNPEGTTNEGFKDEDETTLPANHRVRVTRVEIHDGNQWRDVLDHEREARA